MKSDANGSVLTRLILSLVVPTLIGELWLARNAWIMDERVTVLNEQVRELKNLVFQLDQRLDDLLIKKP